jgi:hypothetical protein
VRPSHAGLETYARRRWPAFAGPIVAHRRVGDDASGRVEPVQIQAEEQAIAGTGLVVQPGRKSPNRCAFGFGAEIGIQRVDDVRHLLQVHRIGGIGRGVAAGYRQGPFGAGSVVPAGIPKLALRNCQVRGVVASAG